MTEEADQFDALLSAWEEGRRRGVEIPPEELARDRPELVPELHRRIGVLRQMGRLAGAGSGTGSYHPTDCATWSQSSTILPATPAVVPVHAHGDSYPFLAPPQG